MRWEAVVPGVWRAAYVTSMGIASNAYAFALKDGALAVLSPPPAADDAFYAATDALGRVEALIAPNTGHDLGQKPWQARYPSATSYAPAIAIAGITKAKPGLRPLRPLADLGPHLPDGVRLLDVPGTRSGMTMIALSGAPRALFVDEIVSNQATLSGPAPARFAFWLTGSGPGLARNKLWTWVFCTDKRTVAKAVLAEVEALDPQVMLPGHGDPLLEGGADAIRRMVAPIA